ncbi:hypothetical protein PoB_003965300 [Plakobranchus ocellatus]|uniref:Uncharacterized protein n=1 Tax=Plakobranchus ocellatus TaxID=259542 RepID=A0AAV4B0R6_9GAST|nr:hypothetical protein PoB_003965300 [Plakobranchus ocellatus]
MAALYPLSDRASDVRPGCKTQRIAPTLRQVADFMCARMKEREYFKTFIVGHVNCCLQCAPTLTTRRVCTAAAYDLGPISFGFVLVRSALFAWVGGGISGRIGWVGGPWVFLYEGAGCRVGGVRSFFPPK